MISLGKTETAPLFPPTGEQGGADEVEEANKLVPSGDGGNKIPHKLPFLG